MKIRTVKYFIGEGFAGLWSNSLMSLASIGTVMAALLIFGMFILFTANLNFIGDQIQGQHEIKVFIDENMNDDQVEEIGRAIRTIDSVKECVLETKEQALENFKKKLGKEKGQILEGLEQDNPLRDSYIIRLDDLKTHDKVVEQLSSIDGIVKVKNAKEVVDLLLRITDVVRAVSLGVMILLALIAVFIISNTIKLAVFARRKEINIMKYVGATDWFIRWPFIVEGMIIGLIGATLALFLVIFGYGYATDFIYRNIGIFQLRSLNEVYEALAFIFITAGTSIGALGSAISIRKYLKV